MLIDILTPFCVQTGYDPVNDRIVALNYINRAAKEIYNGLEAEDGLSEVVLSVPRNLQLTLPHYVGELRGVREYKYSTTIAINSISQPQYSSDTWKFLWRNWRVKSVSPIAQSITNAGILTLEVQAVENPPVVVAIAYSTANSQRVVESITMDDVSKVTAASPLSILSISSPTPGRTYDVVVKDLNGVELATLYNAQRETRYRVIDVSEFQWTGCPAGCGTDTLAELLYKPALVPFYHDTDGFIAEGYDDAIQYKAMELWLYGKEGKEQECVAFFRKATQACDLATRSKESSELKQLLFQPNPIYSAFRRIKRRVWFNNSGMGSGGSDNGFGWW